MKRVEIVVKNSVKWCCKEEGKERPHGDEMNAHLMTQQAATSN